MTLPEIRNNINKWLHALESFRYLQGKHYLKTSHIIPRYCCLGVANHALKLGETDTRSLVYTYQHIGLKNCAGETEYAILTAMNDGGASFKRIAEFIRANPDKVFTEDVAEYLKLNPLEPKRSLCKRLRNFFCLSLSAIET